VPDASVESYTGPAGQDVGISSPTPGTCHIELIFRTGFTYTADVTFSSQTAGSCRECPSYIGPTSGQFMVKNPSSTCVDAASDGGQPVGDGGSTADAPSEATVDAAADAGLQ
jgi:hypothetical protein